MNTFEVGISFGEEKTQFVFDGENMQCDGKVWALDTFSMWLAGAVTARDAKETFEATVNGAPFRLPCDDKAVQIVAKALDAEIARCTKARFVLQENVSSIIDVEGKGFERQWQCSGNTMRSGQNCISREDFFARVLAMLTPVSDGAKEKGALYTVCRPDLNMKIEFSEPYSATAMKFNCDLLLQMLKM